MPRNRECLLIALEGADRVGKATQAKMLEEALTGLGVRATVEEIPYKDGVTYDEIYAFLRDGYARVLPQVFQTLQAVNRRNFQASYLPSLQRHFEVVILDRWNLSTQVYGAADGVASDVTKVLLRGIVEPAINIVLDAPPWPKANLDVLESDNEYQELVRKEYREHCFRDPKCEFVDASRQKFAVHRDVLALVKPLLPPR